MLRDMRTRFFGTAIGHIVSFLWPLTHILILLGIYTAMGRNAPYGDSVIVFSTTALIPFMTFNYTSRLMVLTGLWNKPLLSFPVVKPLDLFIARALLETSNSFFVALILLSAEWLYGLDVVPRDMTQASLAFAASALLGVGFGLFNGVVAQLAKLWATAYVLVIILFWVSCGTFFVPDDLPQQLIDIVSWNPLLHDVEWMRSAYYDGYGSHVMDKSYLLWCGFGSIALGLGLERLVRGRILE